eukprot:TRINITY_DN2410_c0_g1_i1.p1 TRINITY_DN2410_c0_g1~~TRINITY_DN2410_c0_g1_i1.p1  ORF type:complete len:216 (+),score=52.59 TRINITY_DN2410_c0_g1_i1:121-768(+)
MSVPLTLTLLLSLTSKASATLNVKGTELGLCSTPGTALTGFTRDGHCQDFGDDDAGSHHICIAMKPDFCSVTGQPNWCGEKMPCMGQSGNCPIKNWCVCQWAFARYIQMAGGCDSIVDIVCDSTNMAALKAYKQEKQDPSIAAALACMEKRCGISGAPQQLNDATVPQIMSTTKADSVAAWSSKIGTLSVAATAVLAVARLAMRRVSGLDDSAEV